MCQPHALKAVRFQVETRIHISEPLLIPDHNARLRYETLKTMASSYDFNLRSLEEHWRTVYAELFRAILPGHVIVQEEGTLWTYHDTTRNPAAAVRPFDHTQPLEDGSGYWKRPDFRAIVLLAGRIYFPILGECKKAISRQHTSPSGWPATNYGRKALIASLRRAVKQAELQAVVLFKLDRDSQQPATRQSRVCLVAAVGPIYVTALVTREQIERAHPSLAYAPLRRVHHELELLEEEEVHDRARNVVPISPNDMRDEYSTFVQADYTDPGSLLRECWSPPQALDSLESNSILGAFRELPIFGA
ncbi:hypothetical protein B0H12DRAFT_153072 [Mycena haematopus]|nr:hypothetical protein B0H12DRAFT_153072 [Mycena haematopus]